MSWFNVLKNIVTTRQIEAELATLRAECDALKKANASLEAENAALKSEIAEIRKRSAVSFEQMPRLDYRDTGLP